MLIPCNIYFLLSSDIDSARGFKIFFQTIHDLKQILARGQSKSMALTWGGGRGLTKNVTKYGIGGCGRGINGRRIYPFNKGLRIYGGGVPPPF